MSARQAAAACGLATKSVQGWLHKVNPSIGSPIDVFRSQWREVYGDYLSAKKSSRNPAGV